MLRELRTDLMRATSRTELDLRDAAHLLFNRPGLQSVVAYRMGQWLRRARSRPASWPGTLLAAPAYVLVTALVRVTLDIHLAASAEIGPGLCVHHFGGIRVRDCRIGADCVLHHEVRIEPDGQGRGPTIGDRVWIGPNARVIGAITVGDGATIAAGAVVTRDVGADTLVVGNPARPTRIGYDNAALRTG
jgi:serine O-acetyltransferase